MYTKAKTVHPALEEYLNTHFVQNAGFSHESGSYTFCEPGNRTPLHAGGVIRHIARTHYPTHKRSTKRRRKTVQVGSSAAQGRTVDAQIGESFRKRPKHRMALAILAHWEERGETLQACQVPCWVPHFRCMTQADAITRDARGNLHLYELKTGFPVGGYRAQGVLKGIAGNVKSTVMNHWQLQLRYTQLGLPLPFASAVILQVCDTRGKGLQIKRRKQEDWVQQIK